MVAGWVESGFGIDVGAEPCAWTLKATEQSTRVIAPMRCSEVVICRPRDGGLPKMQIPTSVYIIGSGWNHRAKTAKFPAGDEARAREALKTSRAEMEIFTRGEGEARLA